MVVLTPHSHYDAERMEAEDGRLRRLQRLKEVRAAEAKIAAATRAQFRKVADHRAAELLSSAKRAWEAAHNAEVEKRSAHVAAVQAGA